VIASEQEMGIQCRNGGNQPKIRLYPVYPGSNGQISPRARSGAAHASVLLFFCTSTPVGAVELIYTLDTLDTLDTE
jgi:hypothetical protein